MLGREGSAVMEALKRARQGIFKRIEQSEVLGNGLGYTAAGHAAWPFGGIFRRQAAVTMNAGWKMAWLSCTALGMGRAVGSGFPVYYTLLTLTGIDHPAAIVSICMPAR